MLKVMYEVQHDRGVLVVTQIVDPKNQPVYHERGAEVELLVRVDTFVRKTGQPDYQLTLVAPERDGEF
jgi:hypothetical protein